MGEKSLQLRLGAAIRERRVALGLIQEGFADAIKMHRAYYSKIERGEQNLTLMTLLRVSVGLGIKPSQVLRDVGH